MNTEDEYYMMFFSSIDSLKPEHMKFLLSYYGSPKEAFFSDELYLMNCEDVIGAQNVNAILNARRSFEPEREYERLLNNGIRYCSWLSDEFPEKLRTIPDKPIGLFYKGELPTYDVPAIAIVGSRACSQYGKETAIAVARKLAQAGVVVISGMAMGVDGYSHRGALNGKGKTWAVLGCGPDICYPMSNIDIYERIISNGGILSEYYPGKQPLSMNFPKRNRIISGLSDGVLVIEARKKSGTLITVDYALEQGRNIYVVPGRICDPLSEGCNRLLRVGAKPFLSEKDILEDLLEKYQNYRLLLKTQKSDSKKTTIPLDGIEKKLYASLSSAPLSADIIAKRFHLCVSEVLRILISLEMKGLCSQLEEGFVKRY